jgi:hypothetical protein
MSSDNAAVVARAITQIIVATPRGRVTELEKAVAACATSSATSSNPKFVPRTNSASAIAGMTRT